MRIILLILCLSMFGCISTFNKADKFFCHANEWNLYYTRWWFGDIQDNYSYQDKHGFNVKTSVVWNKREIMELLDSTNANYHDMGEWLLHDYNEEH